MNIETLTVGPFQENCNIVWNDDKALIIDPGAEADRIAAFIRAEKLELTAYLFTHGHPDHISALNELLRILPAPCYMHAADQQWAFEEANQIPPYYGATEKPTDPFSEYIHDGENQVGSFRFQAIPTPGHTPGGVSLYFSQNEILISGDTLFKGTCGRTDLPRGDAKTLKKSLMRLKELPDSTVVYPGHGTTTTIGQEKEFNMFMR